MPKPDQPSAFERQSGTRTPRGRGPRSSRWEAVWQGSSEMAASIIAGGLEADGIRAVMSGGRPLQYTGAIAFGSGTWSVSVPSSRAARARALLRESGEGSGVVSGAAGLGGNQLATLKFVLVALVLPVVALVIFLVVNDAVSS